MEGENSKRHTVMEGLRALFNIEDRTPPPKPPKIQEVTWTGMQLIRRVKGTNEIYHRSFPFWGPGREWAMNHARKTNKSKNPNEKTDWTHLLVFAEFTENDAGHKIAQMSVKEEITL